MDDDDSKMICLQNNLLEKADKDFGVLPTIIAMLMGFYLNLVSVRWWDQVYDGKLKLQYKRFKQVLKTSSCEFACASNWRSGACAC